MENEQNVKGEKKLNDLRALMKEFNFNAYIVPHTDRHDNEYIAAPDERVKFISNFGGSNGICLITYDKAFMWTDGRYYIQAEKELYSNWEMKKMERGQPDLKTYIKDNIEKNSNVGLDFNLFSNEYFETLSKFLNEYKLVHDENNIVDRLWENKPTYSKEKVLVHSLEYAGDSVLDKYKRVRNTLKSKVEKIENTALLVTRLDDIAWITNMRGQDIEFNPVFFSYGILYITENEEYFHLFAEKEKFDTPEIKEHLNTSKITLFDYNEVNQVLKLETENQFKEFVFVADSGSINQYMYNLITNNFPAKEIKYKIIDQDPVEYTKHIKTERELKGLRECNIRDGAALVKYFAWLENKLVTENVVELNEYQAALESEQFRSQGEHFKGLSFETISSTGPNAAIIHYKPDENTSSLIKKENIYLIDSGGQYLDGTTDTTRTVHFTAPSLKEKEMYTRVLLGNLSLQRCNFMKRWNYNGGHLDAIARQYLWQVKCEYLHGTGHGVGYFLNVHEGPHGIGGYPGNPALVAGMVVTNEPGYYLKDEFGIRIENMLVVREDKDDPNLLQFENITIVPYENSLLDFSLLSDDFIEFINGYHEEVHTKLSPLLKDDELALKYLERKTKTLTK